MLHPIDRGRAVERLEAIPRLALGHYPTPVEKLSRLREALGGGPRLWMKRDDFTGPGCGGNKVRKLEYVLGAALKDGAEAVITCGGVKSNHCRATAMLAAKLGLECTLVLNQPGTAYERVPASLAIDEMVGAKVVPVYRREERGPMMERVQEEYRAAGKKAVVIPLGASTGLGAIGFVSAMGELAGQMAAKELRFDWIFVSSSSGGTQAGLLAGRELFLRPEVRVVGVSPDDPSIGIQATVGSILEDVSSRLGIGFDLEPEVWDGYVGPGYGIESEGGREALELVARSEGILLDPVYTAKAMAGLIDGIRRGVVTREQNVLFWHTGGQMALFWK